LHCGGFEDGGIEAQNYKSKINVLHGQGMNGETKSLRRKGRQGLAQIHPYLVIE
jgi:hypothetical protein